MNYFKILRNVYNRFRWLKPGRNTELIETEDSKAKELPLIIPQTDGASINNEIHSKASRNYLSLF